MSETTRPQKSQPVSKSSLRLLILSPSKTIPQLAHPPLLRPLLTALTGIEPPPSVSENGNSFAGYTSHPPVQLRNKYYATDISIWCDELPASANAAIQDLLESTSEDEQASLKAWREQMCSDAAHEVRGVIGGIIVAFPFDEQSMLRSQAAPSPDLDEPREASEESERCFEYLDAVNEVRDLIEDEHFGRELPLIAVLQGKHSPNVSSTTQSEIQEAVEQMEEEWMSTREALGWDFVAWDGDLETAAMKLRDENGEKTGIAKIFECLELANWNAKVDAEEEDSDLGEEQDVTSLGLREDGIRMQSHELEEEMMSLKLEMMRHGEGLDEEEDDQSIQAEQFQGLMERATAIKEAASELQGQEKSDFARREIDRLLKDLG